MSYAEQFCACVRQQKENCSISDDTELLSADKIEYQCNYLTAQSAGANARLL